jgi:hypothetical protein
MRPFSIGLLLTIVATTTGGAASAATWYASATAAPGGDGSNSAPFDSLAGAETASIPGDTIVILPAPLDVAPLDGGIALKAGQILMGGGPSVVTSIGLTALPRITNSTGARHAGDVVDLADHAEVTNLVIAGSYRGGIYGSDITGANLHGNDVSGFNTSCTLGFYITSVTAPTTIPYVGSGVAHMGLIAPTNGWAGIMVDELTETSADVSIDDNYVHDGVCGDAVDIRLFGAAVLTAHIGGNFITRIPQGNGGTGSAGPQSVLGIGVQTNGNSKLVANLVGNTETYVGNPGATVNADTLFAFVGDSSTLIETIDQNTMAHGTGGLSTNGLEFVSGDGNDMHGEMHVSNSTFDGDDGDMIEMADTGTDSTMLLEFDNVVVRNTTLRTGNTTGIVIPFNIGECLVAGDSGAGDVFTVRVRNSEFTGCNDGISIVSNVAATNGVGPDNAITIDIADSKIHDNQYYNLWFRNFTILNNLFVKVQNTELTKAGQTNVAFDQEPGAYTVTDLVDLGGGALGSTGNNCIFGGGTYDAETTLYDVMARQNWWGAAGGPAPGKTSATPPLGQQRPLWQQTPGASITSDPALSSPSLACQ